MIVMSRIAADILGVFRRRETMQLEMPAETLEFIKAAAAFSGCSVQRFIIDAAEAHAREVLLHG